mgnify:CR=1 FL=1
MVKLDSLMTTTDNFVGDDLLMEQREYLLPSDTCMTSSENRTNSEGQTNLHVNFEMGESTDKNCCLLVVERDSDANLLVYENNYQSSFSDNQIIYDAASDIKDMTYVLNERQLSKNSLEQHENHISDLQPVKVLNINDNSTCATDEALPFLISREGKRK